MINRIIAICIIFFLANVANAQEINATVIINTQQLGTNVDQSVFQNLQNQMTEFLNSSKWTCDNFQQNEEINYR